MKREDERTEAGQTSDDRGVYIISVAAELIGAHPQTLRIYERKGLLSPTRTRGNTRRYSERDIERLRTIQRLTQEGVSLAGVQMILDMETQLEALERRMEEMRVEAEHVRNRALQEIERIRRQSRAEIVPMADVRRLTPPIRYATQPVRRGPIAVGPVPITRGKRPRPKTT
jgi:MerR family transcriptional regulator/heat shock protein HspR